MSTSLTTTTTSNKGNHPPHIKILNLPTTGKTRRKPGNLSGAGKSTKKKGKLESLFDEEREFSKTYPAIVLLSSDNNGRVGNIRERETRSGVFEAEILRAECRFLRMERELAIKKLERNKQNMEMALSQALQTFLSGKRRIYEGKNVGLAVEGEIEDLAEKLEELQRSYGVKDFEVQNCGNFDKKASILQRRLEKLGGLSSEKNSEQISEKAESSLSINESLETDKESFVLGCKNSRASGDVELLRKKMEGISKGMLDRMEEEYGSMLSTTANSSVASSASTSKRIEFPDSSSFSTRQTYQEAVLHEENKCSGRCKAVVRRIVEQVRAETEQWSQMQEMLGQVREEMEELQASRDFWEDHALKYDEELQSLRSSVQEWKDKAFKSEAKANELKTELCTLKAELQNLSLEPKRVSVTPQELASSTLYKQLEKEKQHMLVCQRKGSRSSTEEVSDMDFIREKLMIEQDKGIMHKDLPPISLGRQLEKEKKRIYFCRVKENHRVNEKCSKVENLSSGRQKSHRDTSEFVAHRRQVFRDIGNSEAMVRQNGNGNAVFP